jgi:hypothetical protein
MELNNKFKSHNLATVHNCAKSLQLIRKPNFQQIANSTCGCIEMAITETVGIGNM